MKNLIFWSLIFLSSRSLAINELERGVLWIANSASMGTYLAQMEGEIAQIKLDYAKKLAETKLTLEKDRQAYLKKYLIRELDATKVHRETLAKELAFLNSRSTQFDLVLEVSREMFRGLLDKELLHGEIKKLNEISPGVQKEWSDLVKTATSKGDSESISSSEFELILMKALEIQAHSSAIQFYMTDEIARVDAELLQMAEQIEAMK